MRNNKKVHRDELYKPQNTLLALLLVVIMSSHLFNKIYWAPLMGQATRTRPSPRGVGFWSWQGHNRCEKYGLWRVLEDGETVKKNKAPEAAAVSLGREQRCYFQEKALLRMQLLSKERLQWWRKDSEPHRYWDRERRNIKGKELLQGQDRPAEYQARNRAAWEKKVRGLGSSGSR